jgi:ribosomal 30S subunit maturation factor RimM
LKNLRSIGHFSRILKKDGTLLFNSEFRDNEFLLSIKTIYHSVFHTGWDIVSIKKVSKGFHIKLKGVACPGTASYFIGEEFSVHENDIKGKSSDLLVGEKVFDLSGNPAGEITSISQTPGYALAEIRTPDKKTYFLPLISEFISYESGRIVLLKKELE